MIDSVIGLSADFNRSPLREKVNEIHQVKDNTLHLSLIMTSHHKVLRRYGPF